MLACQNHEHYFHKRTAKLSAVPNLRLLRMLLLGRKTLVLFKICSESPASMAACHAILLNAVP